MATQRGRTPLQTTLGIVKKASLIILKYSQKGDKTYRSPVVPTNCVPMKFHVFHACINLYMTLQFKILKVNISDLFAVQNSLKGTNIVNDSLGHLLSEKGAQIETKPDSRQSARVTHLYQNFWSTFRFSHVSSPCGQNHPYNGEPWKLDCPCKYEILCA